MAAAVDLAYCKWCSCVRLLTERAAAIRQHLSRNVEQLLGRKPTREIDMNIRKRFEQTMAALIYATALVVVGGGTILMCLPNSGSIA